MDVAAVEPILTKAGGILTTWDGKTIGENDTVCVSSNEILHKILSKKIAKIFINTILILCLLKK